MSESWVETVAEVSGYTLAIIILITILYLFVKGHIVSGKIYDGIQAILEKLDRLLD